MTRLSFFAVLLGGLTSLLIGVPLILWWAMQWLDDEMEAFASLNARSPCKYDPSSPQGASSPKTRPRSPYEMMHQSSPRPVPYGGYPYNEYD